MPGNTLVMSHDIPLVFACGVQSASATAAGSMDVTPNNVLLTIYAIEEAPMSSHANARQIDALPVPVPAF